ncbi:uncharacterized protein LOC126907062 isoform X3 [Daktulosphaira vitifoliae]|uniref:uncharacterized protein LOC126907062 isoform X3 n=1 Tax=Daktulosphaira vitifoliae TaxID=58002 RepID=UPI0021AA6513|nr:uncharacterized protein LOC126907062 isoform X3 [Daktulosphaira vitifoliae]
MYSLNILKIIFLLFYVIFYTKAPTPKKKLIIQFDQFLNYPGWQILHDVHSIKYCNRKFYAKSLIETPTEANRCTQKIRALNVYLGCSYAKVMNNLLSIFIKCLQNCQKNNKETNDLLNGCINTEELINIMALFIVPTATLMKGAVDALDLFYQSSMPTLKIKTHNTYIMSFILEAIEDIINKLNNPLPSCDVTNSSTCGMLYSVCNNIIDILKSETELYCEFVPYDTNYLWNEWNQEYKAIIDQGVKIVFVKFLTRKINDYIKTVVIEKYFLLGFKFDSITEETFAPTPEKLFELDQELEFK